MPGVQIELRDDLPPGVPLVAEFGPGFIHIAVRAGLTQAETVTEIAQAWAAIREHYGTDKIRLLEAS